MNRHACLPALLALIFISACHFTPPPSSSDAVAPPGRVVAPVIGDPLGKMILLETGLWAYVVEDESRVSKLESGQIVAFGDIEKRTRHLFAVIESYRWGARLQRLDVAPVPREMSGSIIPLSTLDIQTAKRWRFCAGTSFEPESDDCLSDATPGTRWHVFEMTGDNRARVEPTARSGPFPLLPVPRIGVVHVAADGLDVHARPGAEGAWLAVASSSFPRPTVPRVAVSTSCPDPPKSDAFDAQWFRRDLERADHPLTIESAAYTRGADALVWCRDGRSTIGVPALQRARLKTRGGVETTPPLVGAEPVRLGSVGADQTAQAARFGAAASTGDFVTADFYLEALARAGLTERIERLMLDSMGVMAAAGRPEAALRAGTSATRRDWNPENSPRLTIGLAAVEDALGLVRESLVRTNALAEQVNRTQDEALRGWIVYFDILDRGTKSLGPEIQEAIDGLGQKKLPRWQLALRAEAARRRGAKEELRPLEPMFREVGAGALHAAYGGQVEPLECDSDGCALDVYGRIFVGSERAIPTRVGRAKLRPGYTREHVERRVETADDDLGGLRVAVAAYPLVEDAERKSVLEKAVERGAAVVATDGCDEDAVASLRTLGVHQSARLRDWREDPVDSALVWTAVRGVPAACESNDALFEQSAELATEHPASSWAAAELMSARLGLVEDGETRADLLRRAAAFAAQNESAGYCDRWNLALAASFADAGRLEEARRFADRAGECEDGPVATEELVDGYIAFQRSGQIPRGVSRQTREKIERIVHMRPQPDPRLGCIGLHTLGIAITPHLPNEIAVLAESLTVEPRETGELSLVIAHDNVRHGAESLEAVGTHLEESDVGAASRELQSARSAFRRVGHAPGLARVAFLEEQLFGGDAKAFLPGLGEGPTSDADDSPGGAAGRIRSGEGRALQKKAGKTTPTVLAASLLYEPTAKTIERLRTTDFAAEPAYEPLCRPPDPRTADDPASETIELSDEDGESKGVNTP